MYTLKWDHYIDFAHETFRATPVIFMRVFIHYSILDIRGMLYISKKGLWVRIQIRFKIYGISWIMRFPFLFTASYYISIIQLVFDIANLECQRFICEITGIVRLFESSIRLQSSIDLSKFQFVPFNSMIFGSFDR